MYNAFIVVIQQSAAYAFRWNMSWPLSSCVLTHELSNASYIVRKMALSVPWNHESPVFTVIV